MQRQTILESNDKNAMALISSIEEKRKFKQFPYSVKNGNFLRRGIGVITNILEYKDKNIRYIIYKYNSMTIILVYKVTLMYNIPIAGTKSEGRIKQCLNICYWRDSIDESTLTCQP